MNGPLTHTHTFIYTHTHISSDAKGWQVDGSTAGSNGIDGGGGGAGGGGGNTGTVRLPQVPECGFGCIDEFGHRGKRRTESTSSAEGGLETMWSHVRGRLPSVVNRIAGEQDHFNRVASMFVQAKDAAAAVAAAAFADAGVSKSERRLSSLVEIDGEDDGVEGDHGDGNDGEGGEIHATVAAATAEVVLATDESAAGGEEKAAAAPDGKIPDGARTADSGNETVVPAQTDEAKGQTDDARTSPLRGRNSRGESLSFSLAATGVMRTASIFTLAPPPEDIFYLSDDDETADGEPIKNDAPGATTDEQKTGAAGADQPIVACVIAGATGGSASLVNGTYHPAANVVYNDRALFWKEGDGDMWLMYVTKGGLNCWMVGPTASKDAHNADGCWVRCVEAGLHDPTKAAAWKVHTIPEGWEDQPTVTCVHRPTEVALDATHGTEGGRAEAAKSRGFSIGGAIGGVGAAFSWAVGRGSTASPLLPAAPTVKESEGTGEGKTGDGENGTAETAEAMSVVKDVYYEDSLYRFYAPRRLKTGDKLGSQSQQVLQKQTGTEAGGPVVGKSIDDGLLVFDSVNDPFGRRQYIGELKLLEAKGEAIIVPHGQGKLFWESGEIFTGAFVAGWISGRGKLSRAELDGTFETMHSDDAGVGEGGIDNDGDDGGGDGSVGGEGGDSKRGLEKTRERCMEDVLRFVPVSNVGTDVSNAVKVDPDTEKNDEKKNDGNNANPAQNTISKGQQTPITIITYRDAPKGGVVEYRGEVKNAVSGMVFHGEGATFDGDGAVTYRGSFVDGRRDGEGTCWFVRDGHRWAYSGLWVDDQRHGYGEEAWVHRPAYATQNTKTDDSKMVLPQGEGAEVWRFAGLFEANEWARGDVERTNGQQAIYCNWLRYALPRGDKGEEKDDTRGRGPKLAEHHELMNMTRCVSVDDIQWLGSNVLNDMLLASSTMAAYGRRSEAQSKPSNSAIQAAGGGKPSASPSETKNGGDVETNVRSEQSKQRSACFLLGDISILRKELAAAEREVAAAEQEVAREDERKEREAEQKAKAARGSPPSRSTGSPPPLRVPSLRRASSLRQPSTRPTALPVVAVVRAKAAALRDESKRMETRLKEELAAELAVFKTKRCHYFGYRAATAGASAMTTRQIDVATCSPTEGWGIAYFNPGVVECGGDGNTDECWTAGAIRLTRDHSSSPPLLSPSTINNANGMPVSFRGRFDRMGLPCRGELIYADGSKFEGDVFCHLPHGYGVFTSPGAKKIRHGEFRFGQMHGFGRESFLDSTECAGEFAEDKLTALASADDFMAVKLFAVKVRDARTGSLIWGLWPEHVVERTNTGVRIIPQGGSTSVMSPGVLGKLRRRVARAAELAGNAAGHKVFVNISTVRSMCGKDKRWKSVCEPLEKLDDMVSLWEVKNQTAAFVNAFVRGGVQGWGGFLNMTFQVKKYFK